MTQAVCLLPAGPNYRRESFLAGIRASGVTLRESIAHPTPSDFLIVWNRSAHVNREAERFEQAGARVLVVENGYFGKQWLGRKWFAMAWGHHAGAGTWPQGSAARWESWGVRMAPMREREGDLLILAQRGIGAPGIASPHGWAEGVRKVYGGRIRPHPGANAPYVTLDHDLKRCGSVATWSSSAALHALIAGVPVWYDFRSWIGAKASRHISQYGGKPALDETDRFATMHRLAWAMWDSNEVESGFPFKELLCVF